jgi:hypothetical protein
MYGSFLPIRRLGTYSDGMTHTPVPDSDPTFILVGHCVPDSAMLRSAIRQVAPDASSVRVNDTRSLAQYERSGSSIAYSTATSMQRTGSESCRVSLPQQQRAPARFRS